MGLKTIMPIREKCLTLALKTLRAFYTNQSTGMKILSLQSQSLDEIITAAAVECLHVAVC